MPKGKTLLQKVMEGFRIPKGKIQPYDARTFIGPEKPLPMKGGYMLGRGKYQDIEDIMDLQASEGYFSRYGSEGPRYFKEYRDYEYGNRIPDRIKRNAEFVMSPRYAKRLGIDPHSSTTEAIKYQERWMTPQYELTPIGRRNLEYNYDAGLINDFRKEQKANIDYWKNKLGMTDEEILDVYGLK